MRSRLKSDQSCGGSVTAEFALVLVLLLMMIFGFIEFVRVMYMLNTLQTVTQRAATLAANTDFSNSTAMSAVRQRAIFRTSPGGLLLGEPITDAHIRIRYLSVSAAGGTAMAEIPTSALPACPANNRVMCMQDIHSASCIRVVRAQICDPADAGTCRSVKYQSLFSLVGVSFDLPKATSIVTAETLGALNAPAPCP